MVKINGELHRVESGTTVAAWLASRNIPEQMVAVEYNGEILPKNSFDTVLLKDDDTLEIVYFVGGG
jgi:thiamine biosynthesis protein ThiS